MLKELRILCIEDDINTQKYLKMILENDVKEFIQAFNAKEGLQLYKAENPDIVITDINMPSFSGLELAAKIKEIKSTQSLLFISTFDDKENLLLAINLCCDGFIPKPIDIDALYRQLHLIAQNIEKEKKIHHLANYDALTELPNKIMFEAALEENIEEAKQTKENIAVFFIDLDYFKIVNDKYGHDTGDFVLQHIVKNISHILPPSTMFARRSGDEFYVLLKNYRHDIQLQTLANDIIAVCSKNIFYKGHILSLSCSIGISRFPQDSYTLQMLLKHADQAMYQAKLRGKSRYHLFKK